MIYGIRKLIAYASTFYTLLPGDVIHTGSPEGVGPVKPGDVMLAECAAIGSMQVVVRLHVAVINPPYGGGAADVSNPGAASTWSNQSKPISLTMRLEMTISRASSWAKCWWLVNGGM